MNRAERRRLAKEVRKGNVDLSSGSSAVSTKLLKDDITKNVLQEIGKAKIDDIRATMEYNKGIEDTSAFYGRMYAMLFLIEMRKHKISADRAWQIHEAVQDRIQDVCNMMDAGYENEEIYKRYSEEAEVLGMDFGKL